MKIIGSSTFSSWRICFSSNSQLLVLCSLLSVLMACHSSQKAAQKRATDKQKNIAVSPPITNNKAPAVAVPNTMGFENKGTVAQAQLLLNLFGYDPGKADSTLKEQTISALNVFQASNKLTQGDRSSQSLEALGVQWFDFSIDSLQKALSKKGYDPGPIDGLLGPMTRGGWKDFLKQNNFSTTALTKESRDAVFSLTYQYDKVTDNLLQYDTAKPLTEGAFYAGSISIDHVTVRDIRHALNAAGYDTGEMNDAVTPPLEDALFRFQLDKKLPMGEFNIESLRALGFR